MNCPMCNYVLSDFDAQCPRCVRMAAPASVSNDTHPSTVVPPAGMISPRTSAAPTAQIPTSVPTPINQFTHAICPQCNKRVNLPTGYDPAGLFVCDNCKFTFHLLGTANNWKRNIVQRWKNNENLAAQGMAIGGAVLLMIGTLCPFNIVYRPDIATALWTGQISLNQAASLSIFDLTGGNPIVQIMGIIVLASCCCRFYKSAILFAIAMGFVAAQLMDNSNVIDSFKGARITEGWGLGVLITGYFLICAADMMVDGIRWMKRRWPHLLQ